MFLEALSLLVEVAEQKRWRWYGEEELQQLKV